MKIACISTSRVPSNTANSLQVMKVCQAIEQWNNDVHLWLPRFQTADWDLLAKKYGLITPFGISWVDYSTILKQYDFCWKSVREALSWQAEVIYTWALQAAVLSLIKKRPTIVEFHDYPMGLLGPLLFRLFLAIPGKKLLLITTQALADGLQGKYHVTFPEGNLQIAPNGSEIERYADLTNPVEARKKLGIHERFSIVYTGHFYSGRGAEMLFNLTKTLPQFQFLFIGGRQEDIEPWKQRLQKEDVKNVLVTGHIDNALLPLYQAAGDILVMPYQHEIAGSGGGNIVKVISPMKMFDYLASGRAIIASDIPVFHEVLNNQNALFCPPDDLGAWIMAIQLLANNPQKRAQLAQQARNDAQRYSWKSRAQQTITKIQNLL